MDATEQAQVESSLRASIKLNPNFAPSYDRLAVFLATHHQNLDEARMMALSAVQLEPGNLGYRLNTANVLLQMEHGKDAVAVIRNAMHLAKSLEETAMADNFLQHAEEYAQAQEQNRLFSEQMKAGTTVAEATSHVAEPDVADSAVPEEAVPGGPHRFVVGVLKNVHCDTPAMDLNLVSDGNTLGLHASNYFKVEYSALNVTLKGKLNPCANLEGRPAKVESVARQARVQQW